MSETPSATRCGFIAILGAPNAGKSTLLNRLVGSKVAIVSPRVQTTRGRILGIVSRESAQLIFIDTPGIFAAKRPFEQAMVAAAWAGARDADIALLLVDATRGADEETRRILDRLARFPGKKLLVLNKVDAAKKHTLPPLAAELFAFPSPGPSSEPLPAPKNLFDGCYMISGKTGDGVEDLLRCLTALLPEGPWLFPEDQLTDMPMRQLAAEITREKLFLLLRQELPYSLAVETEVWEEFPRAVTIRQAILVERESQKKIVIGKSGALLKQAGEQARKELAAMLGRKVNLFLFVKVAAGWKSDPRQGSGERHSV